MLRKIGRSTHHMNKELEDLAEQGKALGTKAYATLN